MILEDFEYARLVTAAYKKKRANKELSHLLAQSTRAKIRKACIHVYQERYRKEDEQVLRDFFGPAEPGRQFLQMIQNFEADKFRPLDNYLKGDTEKTDDLNVELLAWLIDFKHRPYSSDNDVRLTEEELTIIDQVEGPVFAPQDEGSGNKEDDPAQVLKEEQEEEPGENNNEAQIPINDVPKKEDETAHLLKEEQEEEHEKNNNETPVPLNTGLKKETSKSKRAVIAFLILIIFSSGIFAIVTANKDNECMYWTGDHFEKLSCNEEAKGRLILPLDEKKLKNFKRITQKDTLSEQSIGKVYYIKDSNSIECYTEGGIYPEDPNRSLKKLSRHIFDKYLSKKIDSSKSAMADRK